MLAYIAGDGEAFVELFRRCSPSLHAALSAELRTREDANDLVQQTFLQLHCARYDFDRSAKLRPWLFTIALNLKRGYFRRARRHPESPWETAAFVEPSDDARSQDSAEARQTLRNVLARLPNDEREAIVLHWFGGLSFPEIAQTLGISTSSVKTRAHRGYERLRTLLGDPRLETISTEIRDRLPVCDVGETVIQKEMKRGLR